MKFLIASDIHGDFSAASAVVEAFERSGADRLVLLGDILYHGPRNDLPADYAPKKVIELLNSVKERILAVRGNCDTEVDQMVLDFPILAEYAFIECNGLRMFVTHGHKYNTNNPPHLMRGDILLHGHTHVSAFEKFGNDNVYVNSGSVSIPKENTPKSYVIYRSENGKHIFDFMTLDGRLYMQRIL